MASARLSCTFLLLYLQGIRGQQASGANQNVQQAMQRINMPNAIQNQNGGTNHNYPQQLNFQQGNIQQAPNIQGNMQQTANIQGNMQQTTNLQGNMKQTANIQGNKQSAGNVHGNMQPTGNLQGIMQPNANLQVNMQPAVNFQGNMQPAVNFQGNMQQAANFQGNIQPATNLQGNMQEQCNPQGNLQAQAPFSVQIMRPQQSLPPDLSVPNLKHGLSPQGAANPGYASISSLHIVKGNQCNGGLATPPQNIGPPNTPTTQISNVPWTASYAESMKSQPSVPPFNEPQNNFAPNQQVYLQNPIPPQNQLTDVQKHMLVRSLQTQQPVSMQTYLGFNPVQIQPMMENQPYNPVQQQSTTYQPVVPQTGNQPAFITIQAQPLSNYAQNQYSPVEDEDASLMSMILSQLQPSSPQYAIASAFATPKKGKSSLKTLIPLIVNLLKERSGCGCSNCGNVNGCSNNNNGEPIIYGGYSNQKNYSDRKEESLGQKNDVAIQDVGNVKETYSYRNNVVTVDSVETYSDENDYEYVEDEET